ncbi:GGDEF domain-containing protein [Thalassolituus hydrocarboniclasticus]|uniref:Sensor domain-containing diguanylate cyclase n=1 Tax=Thalassolituus hydrocarboniclasticus TaxID=2742796 RepID=A0ABY6AGA6_9GAMM|nr:sensor domain-containing diguanylate cyclase [Thalassolituus hydrocarboniclasticus]UXD88808.1 sensor domain-containing diguanylate cyclase [Thalassolituus hydrocarboniclasticus]
MVNTFTREHKRLKYSYMLFAALTALALLLLLLAAGQSEWRRLQQEFSADTLVVSQFVREKMLQNETLLLALSTYFSGTQQPDMNAVRRYAATMQQRFPHVSMFQSALYLQDGSSLQVFRQIMQEQQLPDNVKSLRRGRYLENISPSEQQALPVIMVFPDNAESLVVGLDLFTVDFIARRLPARQQSRITLSEPFTLLDENPVVVMMLPVSNAQGTGYLNLLVVEVANLLPQEPSYDPRMLFRLRVAQEQGEAFSLLAHAPAVDTWSPVVLQQQQTLGFTGFQLLAEYERPLGITDINWGWLVLLTLALPLSLLLYWRLYRAHRSQAEGLEYQHQLLYRKANYDELTGLPNRYHFEDYATRLLSSAERSGTHLAILFIDLNGFKRINDELGHAAGDNVLAAVGAALSKLIRRGDMAARLGGDEFVVLMDPVSDGAQLEQVSAKLHDLIANVHHVYSERYPLTASLGSAFTAAHGYDLRNLLRVADMAMYNEKQNLQSH